MTIIESARLIDPEAWAEADEAAAASASASPDMKLYLEGQVRRLTIKSLQAAARIFTHENPAPETA